MTYSDVPDLIALSKSLAEDKAALDALKMDRTTASYKMTHGLCKTMKDELIEDLKNSFFSLNLDECTSQTNVKVVAVLACYFSVKEKKVVVKHLSSFSIIKCDSETLFNAIVNLFEELDLPWENLVSVLMDSCNVMRGSHRYRREIPDSLCNGVVSHGAQIGGLRVFADHTRKSKRKTNALTIFARRAAFSV